MPTASLRLAALGDSLSASYAGFPGRSDELSWTQQIEQQHPGRTDLFNLAVSGATSSDVLNGGQADAAHDLVASGEVDYVTLIVGANDLEAELNADLHILLGGNPALFYQTFVTNYTTNVANNINDTLAYISTAGDVGFVVSNIPDVTITPAYAGANPFILFTLQSAVTSANAQIEAIAASREIPIIDLYELSHLTLAPFSIGQVEITNLYAADGFHPNTVAQGVLANTVLHALDSAYEVPVKGFLLSDQQILSNAGIACSPGQPTYFDVTPYVVFQSSNEPAQLPRKWTHLALNVDQRNGLVTTGILDSNNYSLTKMLKKAIANLDSDKTSAGVQQLYEARYGYSSAQEHRSSRREKTARRNDGNISGMPDTVNLER